MNWLTIRKIISKIFLSTLVVLSFAVFFVSSGAQAAPSKDTLVVGVPTDRCPVFYIDNVSGETVGIGVDLIREVAKEAGYDIIIKNITEGNIGNTTAINSVGRRLTIARKERHDYINTLIRAAQ